MPRTILALLGIMVAITVVQAAIPWDWKQFVYAALGCALFFEGEFVPERLYTLVTSIFVHGGWFHLIANAIWMFIAGPEVFARLGPGRFVAFFILCGIAGNVAHVFINWGDMTLVIGASGSVFGLLGATGYIMTRSRSGGPPQARNILHYTVVVLGLIGAYAFLAGDSGISWEAHVGGFVAGLALFPLMRLGR